MSGSEVELAGAATSSNGFSPPERRRLALCRSIAFLMPVVTASASFVVSKTGWFIGGPTWRFTSVGQTYWRLYEWGLFPANALLGSVLAAIAVAVLHPVPGRRSKVAFLWLIGSPFLYILAYVCWERFWNAVA